MKSKKEKLVDGILDKLISTFRDKKSKIIWNKIMQDPEIKAQAKKVIAAKQDLIDKSMSFRKERNKFARDNGIGVNSDGSLDAQDLLKFVKTKYGK